MKFSSLILILYILLSTSAYAQTDSVWVKECLNEIPYLRLKTLGAIPDNAVTKAALYFINKPYVSGTLEINSQEEQLVINTREFDCTTFVETVFAIALTAHDPLRSFDKFEKNLTKIRYRNGEINGYQSRLHYSSDWIHNNIKKGLITDVTKPVGKKIKFNLNFMSANSSKYKYLSEHPETVEKIRDVEKEASKKEFYYIPKDQINSHKNAVQPGDIVFFVTSIQGLDTSHMGIAYNDKGKNTFIHASSKHKKVIINPQSIHDYCAGIKSNKGIIVVRPNFKQ